MIVISVVVAGALLSLCGYYQLIFISFIFLITTFLIFQITKLYFITNSLASQQSILRKRGIGSVTQQKEYRHQLFSFSNVEYKLRNLLNFCYNFITSSKQAKKPIHLLQSPTIAMLPLQNDATNTYYIQEKTAKERIFEFEPKIHNEKIKYIENLIERQIKQYLLCMVFLYYIINIHRNLSFCLDGGVKLQDNPVAHLAYHSKFLVYILPLLNNILWKSQRLYIEFQIRNGAKNQKVVRENKSQSNKQSQSNTNLLIENQHETLQNQKIKSEINVLLGLISLQSTVDLIVLFYSFIYILSQITFSIYSLSTQVYALLLNNMENMQTTGLMVSFRYIVSRSIVLALGCAYILIKDWSSLGKPIGTRASIWKIHLTLDKILRLSSEFMRKKYHIKVFRIQQFLEKAGLIEDSPLKGYRNKEKNINEDISIYYQSV